MAERSEIVSELNALAVHCPPRLMEVEARALWLRDWCDDLAEFPIEAVSAACRKYRQSGQTKFPTPGGLIPLILNAIEKPRTQGPRVETWRDLTDAEYDALDLPDKIRHHRIQAYLARRKAGPMWRDGRPVPAEELPEIWRAWVRRSENHDAEAARLSKFLRRSKVAVE